MRSQTAQVGDKVREVFDVLGLHEPTENLCTHSPRWSTIGGSDTKIWCSTSSC
jgi:hypothetical protein